jgi:phage terminase Nu1 subunit (DNA packaging protein)
MPARKPPPPPSAPAAEPPAPAGPTFPARIIASLLELTERRLQQLVAEGWIPRAERGQYSLRDSVRGYIKYLKEHARDASRSSAQQRLTNAQAVKVEMENYKRAGEYVLREHVHDLLTTLAAVLAGGHEGIASRTANEFAASTDAAFIRQRLQDELRNVRSILADALEKFADDSENRADYGGHDAPAAAQDPEPMG